MKKIITIFLLIVFTLTVQSKNVQAKNLKEGQNNGNYSRLVKVVTKKTGWIATKSGHYYINPNGTIMKGKFQVNNKWYLSNNKGIILNKIGWVKIGENWSYNNGNKGLIANKYTQVFDKRYGVYSFYKFDKNANWVQNFD